MCCLPRPLGPKVPNFTSLILRSGLTNYFRIFYFFWRVGNLDIVTSICFFSCLKKFLFCWQALQKWAPLMYWSPRSEFAPVFAYTWWLLSTAKFGGPGSNNSKGISPFWEKFQKKVYFVFFFPVYFFPQPSLAQKKLRIFFKKNLF